MKHYILLVQLFLSFVAGNCQHATYLFVGTYTDGKPSNGVYVYRMNVQTGKLESTGHAENITNPSFLSLSPNGQYLYACTDTRMTTAGSVSVFAIDSTKGTIRLLNKQSSAGANPVYCSTDKTGRFVVVGNYTEGNVTILNTNHDGSINNLLQTIQFSGKSVDTERQEKPHIHSTVFSPDYRYLYLPDLGADKIRAFKFDTSGAIPLRSTDSLTVNTVPGSGPRHLVFHPNQHWAYCVEEMGGAVTGYRYTEGKLLQFQRINANKKKAAVYSSADIHISPDGLFLYASNRIENTIAVFSIAADGMLTLAGHESTLGEVPRNFCIDPSGHFILVANQVSNRIVVFKRNIKTGLLTATGTSVKVPAPSCLQMRTYR